LGVGCGNHKDWNVRAGQNVPYLAYHIHVGKRWSYIVGSVKFAISPQLWKYMYIKTHSRRNIFTGHGMEFYRTLGNICSEPRSRIRRVLRFHDYLFESDLQCGSEHCKTTVYSFYLTLHEINDDFYSPPPLFAFTYESMKERKIEQEKGQKDEKTKIMPLFEYYLECTPTY
jgi:hypothetical protein